MRKAAAEQLSIYAFERNQFKMKTQQIDKDKRKDKCIKETILGIIAIFLLYKE